MNMLVLWPSGRYVTDIHQQYSNEASPFHHSQNTIQLPVFGRNQAEISRPIQLCVYRSDAKSHAICVV